MFKKIKILVSFLVILFAIGSYAQDIYSDCTITQVQNENTKALTGGLFKPSSNGPGEYFRALIVFAQFNPDTFYLENWPKDSLPTWAYDIIDQEPAQTYRKWTISDYFKTMSRGNFDFIGDIYPYLIRIPNVMHYSNANEYVIEKLNERIEDFSRYDNWYFSNGAFYFSEGNGDGYIDMLIIIYRNAKGWPEFWLSGGIADLGGGPDIILNDGRKINRNNGVLGSGITSGIRPNHSNKYSIVAHLAHEYGHYLFGGMHTQVSGIMQGYPWSYYGTYAMNGWERARLGYISFYTPYNGQSIILRDFVTTGDAIKINILNNNDEYFIVENHQKISPYDQVITGGALKGKFDTSGTGIGKGIYIWYVKNGNALRPDIYSIQADGGFEWIFVGRDTMYDFNNPPPVVPRLDRGNVYRYLPNEYEEIGKCDRNRLYYYASDTRQWEYNDRWRDIDPLTKTWITSREVMGDEEDAFNVNGVDQITPWSNPSTTKLVNNNEVLTGISIKLLGQSGNNISVRVFTTIDGALSLPPSKPQKLKVSVNQNNQAVLTWSPNIEPDVKQGGKYNIYRGYGENGNPPVNYIRIASIPAYINNQPVTSYTDVDCFVGSGNEKLFYRISAVDNTNKESILSNYDWVYWDHSLQKTSLTNFDYNLYQNYPNPFNPVTKIRFSIKETNPVKIKLYDIVGREVAVIMNEVKDAGEYEIELDAGKLGISSGVYFYQMKAGDYTSIKKMVYLK
jgi:hypothetical protein